MPKPKGRNRQVRIKDEEFRSVCAAARTAWHAKGGLPTLDEINAVCDVPRGRIAKVLVKSEFIDVMNACGINWKLSKGLTAKQHYVLQVLTNPTDKRAFADRLKDAGVTYVEYKSWMRLPTFVSLIENFAEKTLGDHLTIAHDSLLKQVEKGNVRALEFYYEMTGRYNRGSQQERDLQSVITGVIDIIQRNVTDQAVLANIAEEMKVLMGKPVTNQKLELTDYREEMGTEDAFLPEEMPDEFRPYLQEALKDPEFKAAYDKEDETIPNIIPPVAKPSKPILTFDRPKES